MSLKAEVEMTESQVEPVTTKSVAVVARITLMAGQD
jgi:hypothetical protein